MVDKNAIDWSLGLGLAVREYQTDIGPADYVLFLDRIPVGVIEAKKEEEGHRLNFHEGQAEYYAKSKLKWFSNRYPLPFVYESTGIVTRFTDLRDPKPRARHIFSFHKPETLKEKIRRKTSLRQRLQQLPELPVEGLRDCQIRNVIKAFREKMPEMFPGRDEVPKTLIFAKTDTMPMILSISCVKNLPRETIFAKKLPTKPRKTPNPCWHLSEMITTPGLPSPLT